MNRTSFTAMTRLESEVAAAARRRDRAYLDTRGLQRHTRRDIGNAWPVKPGVHANRHDVGGSTGRLTARQAAYVAGAAEESLAPAIIEEVLTKPRLYRDRFDPQPWKILALAYGQNLTSVLLEERPPHGKMSDAVVAEMIGRGRSLVQKQRTASLVVADELVRLWKPALDAWHAWKQGEGPAPTPEQDALLTRYSRRTIRRQAVEALERSERRYKDRQRKQATRRTTPGWQAVAAEATDDVGETGPLTTAQAEWVNKRSTEDEQSVEQATEATEWKATKLAEWEEAG